MGQKIWAHTLAALDLRAPKLRHNGLAIALYGDFASPIFDELAINAGHPGRFSHGDKAAGPP